MLVNGLHHAHMEPQKQACCWHSGATTIARNADGSSSMLWITVFACVTETEAIWHVHVHVHA